MQHFSNLIFVCLGLSMLFFSFTGRHGYLHLRKVSSEISAISNKNQELEDKIFNLKKNINELKNSDFAREKTSREQLGLARQNEIVYIFPNSNYEGNNTNEQKTSTK